MKKGHTFTVKGLLGNLVMETLVRCVGFGLFGVLGLRR